MEAYNPILKILPRKTRMKYRQLILYSKIRADPDKFMGSMLLLGLMIVS